MSSGPYKVVPETVIELSPHGVPRAAPDSAFDNNSPDDSRRSSLHSVSAYSRTSSLATLLPVSNTPFERVYPMSSGNAVDAEEVKSPEQKMSAQQVKSLREEMLGPEINGWRRWIYVTDIFAGEQFVRDTRQFDNHNVFFNVLYRSCIVAFFIVFTLAYFNGKSSTSYSMAPIDTMAPINITITLKCNTEYGCITRDVNNVPTLPISVVGVYEHVNKKYCPYESFNYTTTASFANASFSFMSCFSTSYDDGVFLYMPFQSAVTVNNYLMVTVTAPTYKNSLIQDLRMVPSQQKIVYFSQMATSNAGSSKPAEYSPYIADQFYNGKSVNSLAMLTFKPQQFGYSTVTIPPADYLTTLGLIGGFSQLLLPLCTAGKSTSAFFHKVDPFNAPLGQWLGVMWAMLMNGGRMP